MPRREKTVNVSGFVFFDVVDEDGSGSSNRKIPNSELGGIDGDAIREALYRGSGPQDCRNLGTLAGRHQIGGSLAFPLNTVAGATSNGTGALKLGAVH